MNTLVLTSKVLIVVVGIITAILSLSVIIFSGLQGTDRKTSPNYEGSLCSDSILNNYRPFKVHFELKSGNITNYKMCSFFPQQNQTRCFRFDSTQDPTRTLFCGWSGLRLFHHISLHLLLIAFSLFGLLWVIKDTGLWIIGGILYTVFVATGVLFSLWILIMDSWDIHSSMTWCNSSFKDQLCSPSNLIPDVVQNCSCDYFSFIAAGPILHVIAFLVWIFLFVVCCIRWYGYRYHTIEGEYEDLEKVKEPLNPEKVKENIYQRYGF